MEERKKIRFIANPISGANRRRNLPKLIEEHLDHGKFAYELFYTEHAGHAVALAKDGVLAGNFMVVACGGDGSVNEISSQLIGTGTVLGVLPCGSGNGFAMHFGIGRDVAKAIEYLNDGTPLPIDTALLNDRPFVNLAGVGFDGAVAKRLHESRSRGFKAYFRYTFQELLHYRAQSLAIEVDGQQLERRCLLLEVANAPIYGYGFSIVPQASPYDGLLDVLLVKEAPIWRYLLESWRFLNLSFHKSPLVECFSGTHITIRPTGPIGAHLDGEGFELSEEARFSIRPLSLMVMVPKAS